ncbi:hypothetical protein EVAR_7626_1 [Eumeta japonica]|uniref:Uncharacterized protein n=1 Tax=Eumeta variegata TaxID=151549 RepID=A0A4C1TJ94_EUMVA|nr:hypothetical protein EVAR_7626_1 [Eumeta japonica]
MWSGRELGKRREPALDYGRRKSLCPAVHGEWSRNTIERVERSNRRMREVGTALGSMTSAGRNGCDISKGCHGRAAGAASAADKAGPNFDCSSGGHCQLDSNVIYGGISLRSVKCNAV